MAVFLQTPDSSTKATHPARDRAPGGRGTRPGWSAGWLSAGLLLAVAAAPAQQFTARVDLVEVYATVVSSRGEPLEGLTAGDFEVLEDGRPREVAVFAAGEFPLSVALAIDRSFSMAGSRIAVARSAGHTFLGALRDDDQAMIIAVGSEVETLAPLSRDRDAQHRTVSSLQPWGTTGLYDAVIAAVDRIQSASGRRALVLLSDGRDRYSRATADAALEHARARDVLIYPVALGDRPPQPFMDLATVTGGRAFHVRRIATLSSVLESIAAELRQQYLLGFVPAVRAGGEPTWHTIEVRVARAGARVRARPGYWSRE